jgi:tetratricopeptide (TPR) repeat protein
LPVLQHCASLDPRRPRVQFQLGTALAATGDRAAALEAFGLEIRTNDDEQVRTLAHLNRALLFQRDGNWLEAAADLEAVLAIQPERTELYGDLATVLLQAGKPLDAWTALQRGAGAGFRSGEHFYSVGARLYRSGEYDAAVEAFRGAIEADPGRAASQRSLAAALERLGRDDEAREHLRRYLELRPDAPDADEVSEALAADGSS